MREAAVRTISSLLGIESHINDQALVDFALMLSLVPGLDQWSTDEKDALCQIIEAKGKGSESNYLRLMQKHERFREEVIRIGSNRPK
jgi:hypothetical protein